ncbi:Acetokinase family-domain-containing protein [Boletus edulis BED1]|uniref:Probable acetate kinase n=1 Tax=Boletus edulis BED1 TaxID=1328754 RepID=A0AAD4BXN4_BOLED|nr:Acetokinase family-domain-containing protein [Boletus edulis BED1]
MSLILAVNAGSSSLKISLYQRVLEDPKAPRLSLTSTISSISSPPARVSFQQHPNLSQAARHPNPSVPSIRDHESAFIYFLDRLKADVSIDRQQVTHICHRVVHGGDYTEPTVISEQSYHHIETLSDLAPLHNAAALSVIRACIHALPLALSIAFFDTAFHRDLPRHVSTYAIDQKIAQERGLKKYGFHGLSYAFIIDMVADHLHKDKDELNIIALHLGSGASACAIRGGKSIDTSMGLTPLSGLPGATRAGDVDPSLIFHYASEPLSRLSYDSAMSKEVHVTRAEEILNRQAGWKALTGTTDFGEIIKKADLSTPPSVAIGDPCTLAFHIVLGRILHYVGAYHLSLRGKVDALVFAGGIGERSQDLRSAIGEAVNCLGYSAIDEHVNQGLEHHEGSVVDIGKDEGGNRMLVCRTDEQFEMARECSLGDAFWR